MIDPADLPATLTVRRVAEELIDASESAIYDAIAAGTFPVEVLRIGRKILVPTRPLLAVLGIEAT